MIQPDVTATRLRQRRKISWLAWSLIAAGLAILLLLDRIPLPLRLLMGFVDLVAGAGLLVLRRQKFPDLRKTSPR
ncbi:MAG: hypothetical protein ACKPB0_19130 [Opitutaceae bacterium]